MERRKYLQTREIKWNRSRKAIYETRAVQTIAINRIFRRVGISNNLHRISNKRQKDSKSGRPWADIRLPMNLFWNQMFYRLKELFEFQVIFYCLLTVFFVFLKILKLRNFISVVFILREHSSEQKSSTSCMDMYYNNIAACSSCQY